MAISLTEFASMSFPERLSAVRKERGLTQAQMAERIGVHVSQLKRYEAGNSQPTVEVFRRIVLALNVSADTLLFDPGERGPQKEDLKLQFEAVSKLSKKELETVKTVLDSILLMHDARRYTLKGEKVPSG